MFQLTSSFKPTGDQPQAIEKLTSGIKNGLKKDNLFIAFFKPIDSIFGVLDLASDII